MGRRRARGYQPAAPTAATAPDVARADALQYELDEGPCLLAWREQRTVRVDDVATDDRWPRWSAAVAPLGLRSSLSVPMLAGASALGAVKVYARVPAAYGERDERVLTLFARQAGVLLANVQSYESNRQLIEQLQEALVSRDLIGQAKGVLMVQQQVDATEAFAMLARLSQQANTKLRDVATRVVAGASEPRR